MTRARLRHGLFFGVLALGCSSKPLDDGGSGGTNGAAGSAAQCDEPVGYASPRDTQYVGNVQGLVLGLDGTPPPADLLVQVCGLDRCIGGATDATGAAAVPIDSDMIRPAFKYGDGLTYGKIALLLPSPSDMVDMGTVYTPALPSFGARIDAGTSATSQGVVLTVPQGGTVAFDRLTYRTADEQAFRAEQLLLSRAPAGLDQGYGFELYVALAPLDTQFCPPASLSIANYPSFEASATIEFYLHGLDVGERYAPYGGWSKFGEGAVTVDGGSIEIFDALPVLSLVALRRKPP